MFKFLVIGKSNSKKVGWTENLPRVRLFFGEKDQVFLIFCFVRQATLFHQGKMKEANLTEIALIIWLNPQQAELSFQTYSYSMIQMALFLSLV